MLPPFTIRIEMSNEEQDSMGTENESVGESSLETETVVVEQGGVSPAEPEPLTPEEVEALKAKAAKADENWEKFLRQTADFENFKKRAARERLEAIKFANEGLLAKLIPVMDNFEMAASAATGQQADNMESIKTGVQMILGQLKSVLVESGIEEVDATGKVFDPVWHEAVSQQESTDVEEGQVLQQIRKGYKLKERLIRPASVVVAKKPAQ
jgi:molecular chaperone GrpE